KNEAVKEVMKGVRAPFPTAQSRKWFEEAFAEQRRLADEYERVPPFQTDPVRALHDAGRQVLAERTAFLDLCVRRQRWPVRAAEHDPELREQSQRMGQALRRYNELAGK